MSTKSSLRTISMKVPEICVRSDTHWSELGTLVENKVQIYQLHIRNRFYERSYFTNASLNYQFLDWMFEINQGKNDEEEIKVKK